MFILFPFYLLVACGVFLLAFQRVSARVEKAPKDRISRCFLLYLNVLRRASFDPGYVPPFPRLELTLVGF